MNDRHALQAAVNEWTAATGQHLGSVRAAIEAGQLKLAAERFERVRRITAVDPPNLTAAQLLKLDGVPLETSVLKIQLWLGGHGRWAADDVVARARRQWQRDQQR